MRPPHAARAFLNTTELNKRGAVALLPAARRECGSILKRAVRRAGSILNRAVRRAGSILKRAVRRAERAPSDRQP